MQIRSGIAELVVVEAHSKASTLNPRVAPRLCARPDLQPTARFQPACSRGPRDERFLARDRNPRRALRASRS
jgi:hypothetical protein